MNKAGDTLADRTEACPRQQTFACGLIGWPVAHSLSPLLQQFAADSRGIELSYQAIAVPPGKSGQALLQARNGGFSGLNVTTPLKEEVIPFLDRLDGGAHEVGAVNTIQFEGATLLGYNTDSTGGRKLLQSLQGLIKPGGPESCAVIFGSGPAARALALASREVLHCSPLLVSRSSSSPLRGYLGARGLRVAPAGSSQALLALETANLVINATPLGSSECAGQTPLEDASLLSDSAFILDLIYAPQRTPLIEQASKRGLATMNGLGLLCYQAADSFNIWTGSDVTGKELLDYLVAEGYDAALSDGR
jgi:shikimate dehydrogenase